MDWDDLRFFLELIRHKSLSTAARKLHVTQSTVGRRLASLERRLGVKLVHRRREGYAPTPAGEAIRQHVERVEAETQAIDRVVGGLDHKLEGVVRVTSPALLASHLLAPSAAALHMQYPEIMLEVLCYAPNPDLSARDADVAVQLHRFDQPGLIVRRVGTLAFGMYASLAYLSQCGEPDWESGCSGHRLITVVEESKISAQADWLANEPGGRGSISGPTAARRNSGPPCRAAASPCFLVSVPIARARCGGYARIPPFRAPEIRIAVHQDNRQVPRIRAVLDTIVDSVRRSADALNPDQAGRDEAA